MTFWAVFCLAIEGISSHLETALNDGQLVPTDIFSIVRIVAATVAGCIGRYNASEIIYTPEFLPGRNKDEAEGLVADKNNAED
ncbi:MAG TPA: hypothetical protein DCY88_07975 [Cyanobacteria bacterium UBA11372]|nr:hypothetical protein [Cyanobacteria bacterium UBA11372]